MHAIAMLRQQHRELERLFEELERAGGAQRQALLLELADALAAHLTIEERHFYPAVREKHTEALLLESLEEHLEIKRLLAGLLEPEGEGARFEARLGLLREQLEQHLQEEEEELFPSVGRLFHRERLEQIAREMQETLGELEEPRAELRELVFSESGG